VTGLDVLALMKEALSLYREQFGADYCDTLGCQYDLARLLWEIGRRDESAALYEATLVACKRALGADDDLSQQVAQTLAAMRDARE
jgi:hypothetical protein